MRRRPRSDIQRAFMMTANVPEGCAGLPPIPPQAAAPCMALTQNSADTDVPSEAGRWKPPRPQLRSRIRAVRGSVAWRSNRSSIAGILAGRLFAGEKPVASVSEALRQKQRRVFRCNDQREIVRAFIYARYCPAERILRFRATGAALRQPFNLKNRVRDVFTMLC